MAILNKRLLPVRRLLVATRVDELLELSIRHLVPIHPVVWDLDCCEIVEAFKVERNIATLDSYHSFGNASIRG